MRERILALLTRLLAAPTGTGFERLCAEAFLRLGAEMRGQEIVERRLSEARSGLSPEGVYVLCSFAEAFVRLERVERAIPLVQEAARMPRVLDPARTAERHLDLAGAYAAVRRPADARLQLELARDEQLLHALDLEGRVDHLARVAAALLDDLAELGAARETFARALALERGLDPGDGYRASVFARTAANLGLADEVERRLPRVQPEEIGALLGALVGASPDVLDRARELVDGDPGPLRTSRMIALAAGIAPHAEHAEAARGMLDEALARVKDEPAERRWESLALASDVLVADLLDFAGGLRIARESFDAFGAIREDAEGWGSRAVIVAGALIAAGDLDHGLALAERRLGRAPGSAALVSVALLCRSAADVVVAGPKIRRRP